MLSDDVQKGLVEQQGFIPVSEMKVVKDASGKVAEKKRRRLPIYSLLTVATTKGA